MVYIALDAATGAFMWNYMTGNAIAYSSPAVANGLVYMGSYDGNVYYFNSTSGASLGNYRTGSIVTSSPAVANGSVYVGSYDENVYRLPAILTVPTSPILNPIIPSTEYHRKDYPSLDWRRQRHFI